MIVAAAGTGSAVVYVIENEFKRRRPEGGTYELLFELISFLLGTMSNIMVQLTSSLAATMAASVYRDAVSVWWGMLGALIAISLLWLLQQSALIHVKEKHPFKDL
jgi:hypothetical protein